MRNFAFTIVGCIIAISASAQCGPKPNFKIVAPVGEDTRMMDFLTQFLGHGFIPEPYVTDDYCYYQAYTLKAVDAKAPEPYIVLHAENVSTGNVQDFRYTTSQQGITAADIKAAIDKKVMIRYKPGNDEHIALKLTVI